MTLFKPVMTLAVSMPKPIAETSTTIKAGKSKHKVTRDVNEAPRRDLLQPVGGGRVRRVEFEPEVETRTAEVRYQPKHDASMDHIHFEVDNIDRLQRGVEPRRATALESKRVFETKKGGVNATDVDTHRGRRRVLYTERKRGERTEETRFHSGLVDKIIAERYKGGPQFEEVDEEKPRFGLFKKKDDAKPATRTRRKETVTTTVTKGGKTTTSTTTKTSGWSPDEPKADTKQCAAYTKDGDQCKRNARKRAKYCTQHRNYRAPSKKDL